MADVWRAAPAMMLAVALLSCSTTGPAGQPTSTTARSTTTSASATTTIAPDPAIGDEGAPDPAAAAAVSPLPARITPSSSSPACQSDPHAGVYRPQRLEVIDPCAWVSGTVRYTELESDGDTHIGLAVDPAFTDHLNIWNHIWQQGQLLVEIVPANRDTVSVPAVRSHVTVVGPYVLDRAHGWMEIHPTWSITPAVNKP
jgi:hypothetical protein